MALQMRLCGAAECSTSAAARDTLSCGPTTNWRHTEGHPTGTAAVGSRHSAFFTPTAPSLRLQRNQQRAERPQLCHAQLNPAVAVSATLVGPELTQTAQAPAEKRRTDTARERNLRQTRGGRESEEYAMRLCVDLHERSPAGGPHLRNPRWAGGVLDEAYERAGIVTSEYAKTFYLGTKLMTPEKARAVWAIYVWCRRTDELVDGPNASRITPEALDRWEERLEGIFDGRPYDVLDAALSDTVSQYPVHIQPFRDMIDGMRMDLVKSRYETYDELYGYCYKVAGTVALMTTPVMGINPDYTGPLDAVYKAALALGTANQLTNILRDVGEDVNERNRIYVPLEELDRFGIKESEVVNGMFAATTGKIDDRWRRFMQFQIERNRQIFADAEAGVDLLANDARLPVWAALMMYRQILDSVEKNDYNNFTQRAYVPKWKKYMSLPRAILRAQTSQIPRRSS